MGKAKIVYHDWIVEIGADPRQVRNTIPTDDPILPNAEIIREVREALAALPAFQRELIEQYYFMGYSGYELSRMHNLKVKEIHACLRQAVKSLKKSLNAFVREKYGIKIGRIPDCPICESPFRKEIDRLILERDPRETWKKVIKNLELDFGIGIKTPQVLIGHTKYHIKREV